MRRFLPTIVLVAGLATASAAVRAGQDVATWHAAQRAEAAQQALSERYTAIWLELTGEQKQRFSARERAWLNWGRLQEQQQCIDHNGPRTELVARTCEASVIERHLQALALPARLLSSN